MEKRVSNEDRLEQILEGAFEPLGSISPGVRRHLAESVAAGFYSNHQSKGKIDTLAEEVVGRLMDSLREEGE